MAGEERTRGKDKRQGRNGLCDREQKTEVIIHNQKKGHKARKKEINNGQKRKETGELRKQSGADTKKG